MRGWMPWTEDLSVVISDFDHTAFAFGGYHINAGSGTDQMANTITGDATSSPPTWHEGFDPLTNGTNDLNYSYPAWTQHENVVAFHVQTYWHRSYGYDKWTEGSTVYTRNRDVYIATVPGFLVVQDYASGGGG